MYWQVTVTVNIHIQRRPTEHMSTAHRYTSKMHKKITHVSPTAPLSPQMESGKNKQKKECLAELFKALYYILWVGPVQCQSTTNTHKCRHSRNMMTHLQTSSTGCLWPWWLVGHALHGERKRGEAYWVHSHHCGLPAVWLHPGESLNKANCRKTKSRGWPPPCLSLNHSVSFVLTVY